MPAEPRDDSSDRFGAVIVSCEHASGRVPARHAARFRRERRVLSSHRGLDIGAAWLARRLAPQLNAPLHLGRITRLIIDLNRSLHHRAVWSSYTRGLPAADRERIIDRYYTPYRDAVAADVRAALDRGHHVLHLSVHSFTPRLAGDVRVADIGLLYDPARPGERALCRRWKAALGEAAPGLRVRRNYPYRGTSDGFSVALRRRFPAGYACVELEVNQASLGRAGAARVRLADTLLATLRAAGAGAS